MLEAYEELYFKAGPKLDASVINQDIDAYEAEEEKYQTPPKKKTIKKSPKSANILENELAEVKNSFSNVRQGILIMAKRLS